MKKLVQPLDGVVDGGGSTLEHAFLAHVIRVTPCASALIFNMYTANRAFAVHVLIRVNLAYVAGSAVHNARGQKGCGRSGCPGGSLNFWLRVHETRITVSRNGKRSRGGSRGVGCGYDENEILLFHIACSREGIVVAHDAA